jgi:hypothetical protein
MLEVKMATVSDFGCAKFEQMVAKWPNGKHQLKALDVLLDYGFPLVLCSYVNSAFELLNKFVMQSYTLRWSLSLDL